MSNFVRKNDETEGALLLPEANAILIRSSNNVDTTTPTLYDNNYVQPIDYFHDDNIVNGRVDVIENDYYDNACVQEAVNVSTCETHDEQYERYLLLQAERKGRIEVDQERENVRRLNDNVNTINYFASKAIEEGNNNAIYKNYLERVGVSEPLSDQNSFVQPQITKQDETQNLGTFGKGEYEVSDYQTSDYGTISEYKVPEYKSVYDA